MSIVFVFRCGLCDVTGHEKELHERYGPAGERSTNIWDLMEVFAGKIDMIEGGFRIRK